MKRIENNYQEFLNYKIFESVLIASSRFRDVLRLMSLKGNRIASTLLSIISNKEDVNTKYNNLDLSLDKNDDVLFLPDSQYQRFLTQGVDVSQKTRSGIGVGRLVTQILRENGKNFSQHDVENFINSFKAAWNKYFDVPNREIKLVKGDDILHWYNENNYKSERGTLGNSCMRYSHKNHFMEIYARNPDKINMVIILDNEELVARALVWKLDNGKIYLDRIYSVETSDLETILDWVFINVAEKNPTKLLSHMDDDGETNTLKVTLQHTEFDVYPYGDTFQYLCEKLEDGVITGSGYVTNIEGEHTNEYLVSQIRSHQSGNKDVLSHVWSSYLDEWILKTEAINVRRHGYVRQEMCELCKFEGYYYLKDDLIYSKEMDDYIPKNRVIEFNGGVYHEDAVMEVYTEFIGPNNLHPLELFRQFDLDPKKLFKTELKFKNDSFKRVRLGGNIDQGYFDNKFIIEDFTGRPTVELFCQKFTLIRGLPNEIESIIPSLASRTSGELVSVIDTELLLKSNGMGLEESMIEVESGDRQEIITAWVVESRYRNSLNFSDYVNLINSLKAPENLKKAAIEDKKVYHESLLYDDSYRSKVQMAELRKTVKFEKIYLEVVDKFWEKFLQKPVTEETKRLLEKHLERKNVELNEQQLSCIFGLYKPFIALYPIVGYSRAVTAKMLDYFGDKVIEDIYPNCPPILTRDQYVIRIEELLEVCRVIFLMEIGDIVDDEFNKFTIAREIQAEKNITIDVNYFIEKLNTKEILDELI